MQKPPYAHFPNIRGEHVLLRELTIQDIPQIISISYYDGIQATSATEASTMLEKINLDYLAGDSIHWGIESKATGTIAGTCGFYRGFANNSGELGCVLLPEYEGAGVMTKALQLAIVFGFNTIGLQRVSAFTDATNHKAIALFNRLQFTRVRLTHHPLIEFELLHTNNV